MNWKLFLSGLIIGLPLSTYSQQLSLQDAIEKANSTTLTEAQWQQKIAKLQLQSTKTNRLPLIYGDASVQRNLIIPVTPVPVIAFNPNAAPGEIMPLRFATDWSAKAGLQGSIDIFNPQNHTAIVEALVNEAKANIEIESQKSSLRNTIIDLYAQCLLSIEQLEIAKASLLNYQEIAQIIKARYEAGRTTLLEYNKTLQKVNELEQLLNEANTIVRINFNNLSEFIDPGSFNSLSTSLQDIIKMQASTDSFEIQQLDIDLKYKQFQRNKIKLEALPKLSLNAYYGANHFSNSFNLFQAQNWYGNSYINLTIRVPITETYNRSITAKQLAYQTELSQLKLDDALKKEAIKRKNKAENRSIYYARIENAQKNLSLAKENLSIIEEQAKSGRVLVTELNKEMDAFFNQQKNLWQAQYDYIKKLVD
jgi:outer membrane protein